ncbi:hypothetical protein, partial [Escherichia coli]|uniref:hypothetical protein n=1 Tax=Escherichia coli TaxID=562 RepID=UPI001CDA6623
SLKTSIKTITYLSDTGCLEIQGASLTGLILIRKKNQPLGRLAKSGNKLLYDHNYVAILTFETLV